jgi:pimeloyl-ACP methyl ester carboxylesterase
VALVGFSMGGAVSVGVAGDEAVAGVIGLAPWIPSELPLNGLHGKRFDVVHGAWDRNLPGIPGVSPSHSRAAFERVRAAGVEGTYRLIGRGLHGAAVRRRDGTLVRLPRWHAWVAETAAALARYEPA